MNLNVTNRNDTNCDAAHHVLYKFYASVMIVIFILALPLNASVLHLFIFKLKFWKSNSNNIFLFNLVLADILLLICLPIKAHNFITGERRSKDVTICKAMLFMLFLNRGASIAFLTVTSIDRYYNVVHPRKKNLLKALKKSPYISILIWVLLLPLTIPTMLKTFECCNSFKTGKDDPWMKDVVDSFREAVFFSQIVIPFVILVYCTVRIINRLKKKTIGDTAKLKRAVFLVTTVMVVFSFCFLPCAIARMILLILRENKNDNSIVDKAETVFDGLMVLSYMDCLLDPLVYCFCSTKFKALYISNYLSFCMKGIPEPISSSTGNTTQPTRNKAELHTSVVFLFIKTQSGLQSGSKDQVAGVTGLGKKPNPLQVIQGDRRSLQRRVQFELHHWWQRKMSDHTTPSPDNCKTPNNTYTYQVLSGVMTVEFILGLPLNLSVLYIFIFRFKFWKNNSVFLFNIVVADFLLVACLPVKIHHYKNNLRRSEDDVVCRMMLFMLFLNRGASIAFLITLSLDRYFSVVHLGRRNCVKVFKKSPLISVIIWVFLLPLTIPTMLSSFDCCNSYGRNNTTVLETMTDTFREIVFFSQIIIPFIILIYCTACIIGRLRRKTVGEKARLRRAVFAVMSVAIVFSICFLPCTVARVVLLVVRVKNWLEEENIVVQVYDSVMVLSYADCLLDPLVYCFCNSGFKVAYISTFFPPCLRRRLLKPASTPLPVTTTGTTTTTVTSGAKIISLQMLQK
ncbi:uncharacterized protein gpr31 [Anableps anableps]